MAQNMQDQQALKGKRVAVLMTDGVEQIEYTSPRGFLEQHGAQVTLLSPKEKGEQVQGFNHADKADSFEVELNVKQADPAAYDALVLPGGASVDLLGRMPGSQRLWVASLHLGEPVTDYLDRWGRAIRYRYVPSSWPIDAYRNAYAVEPGSAEMPSAGRPLTPEVITSLVARGVAVTPLVLHTGVASLEGGELPYPERYRVPVETARRVNATHAGGHRVVAIGTTVVRALESVTDHEGVTHAGHGWTDLVITPERGVRAVDGLLTGWHEPEATHLQMLEAVAGRDALAVAYAAALAERYLWHEFGDSHLLLPRRPVRA